MECQHIFGKGKNKGGKCGKKNCTRHKNVVDELCKYVFTKG